MKMMKKKKKMKKKSAMKLRNKRFNFKIKNIYRIVIW